MTMGWGDTFRELNERRTTARDRAGQWVADTGRAASDAVDDATAWSKQQALQAKKWSQEKVAEAGQWTAETAKQVSDRTFETAEGVADWTAEQVDRGRDIGEQAIKGAKDVAARGADTTSQIATAAYDAVKNEYNGGPGAVTCVRCMLKKANQTYQDGRENAQKNNSSAGGWSDKVKAGEVRLKYPPPTQYSAGNLYKPDDESKKQAKAGLEFKKSEEATWLHYGDADNFARFGHVEYQRRHGAGYDAIKNEYYADAIRLQGKVTVVEVQGKKSVAKELLSGKLRGEAGSVAADFTVGSTFKDLSNFDAKAEAGFEFVAVQGAAGGEIKITAKTVYDNTIGSVVEFFEPKSDWTRLSKGWDRGVIVGAEGEAGFGAAAKAGVGFENKDGILKGKAGAKAGSGPMAGVKVFGAIKWK